MASPNNWFHHVVDRIGARLPRNENAHDEIIVFVRRFLGIEDLVREVQRNAVDGSLVAGGDARAHSFAPVHGDHMQTSLAGDAGNPAHYFRLSGVVCRIRLKVHHTLPAHIEIGQGQDSNDKQYRQNDGHFFAYMCESTPFHEDLVTEL
jgi:hypothetical protein